MSRLKSLQIAALILLFAALAPAEDAEFQPLFNGKDLAGWVPVNVAPGTFTARDGMIVSTGVPTGIMRTDKMYENFVLELEYRHMKAGGNAGLFVWSDAITAQGVPFSRSTEIQVLDGNEAPSHTSHGDVFTIHGATFTPDRPHPFGAMRCLPSERRAKPSPEWNHYRVTCKDGVVKLEVNGKEVSGGYNTIPRKGYICLEAEGSECHFKNIKIRELPGGSATGDQVAEADQGFVSLYNGMDFTGWKFESGHEGHWVARDWVMSYDGKSTAKDPNLWSEKEYGDLVMICDWRWTGKPVKKKHPAIGPDGRTPNGPDGKPMEDDVDDAGDSGIYLRGSSKSQVNMWCWPIGSGEVYGYRTDANMPPEVIAGVTPKKAMDRPIGEWNRFVITMKGDRLTVVLNGETVIENAQLPGVAARGPIALQHHGDPIEFANIYIKEL